MKGPESIARPADHGAQAASRVAAQTRRPRCARRLNGAALDPACAPWVKGVWAMDVRGPPAGAPDPGVCRKNTIDLSDAFTWLGG